MQPTIKTFLRRAQALACALLAAFSSSASAQQYPTKPVRIVVPFAPGGGVDFMARLIAQKLPEHLGQQVIVENRGGAGGVIGTEHVAKSPPDGYSILLGSISGLAVAMSLYPNRGYDSLRDFAPVTTLVLLQQMLLATPSLGVSTVADLVKLAKTRPGSINYASYGSGSQPHLAGEMLKSTAGIDLVHIPYKGISLAVPAVAAGEVQLTFGGILTSMSFIKSGRVKPLAIGGTKRSPLLPDVPTFAEVGFPEVETHA